MNSMQASKKERLKEILRSIGSAVVAFSGGVDSTFLLKMAQEELGDRVAALTATSPTYSEFELREAKRIAEELGVRHIVLDSNELQIEGFSDNPPDRCYYCKKTLIGLCKEVAEKLGFNAVLEGSNFSDTGDHRPGMKAVQELGARSPLKEAGLTKEEIRQLSKEMGLPNWNKPAMACLASRFPYGVKILEERLKKIDEAEAYLRSIGMKQFRVRYHGELARIEVDEKQLPSLTEDATRRALVERFKRIGFVYVTLDLQGYRTGSMNEPLEYSKTEPKVPYPPE